MRAIEYDSFGSAEVLTLREIEKPVPGRGEVLVKVFATSVNALDIIFRSGAPKIGGLVRVAMSGIRKPRVKILGTDVSGEVEAVGEGVTRFKPGDPVFGITRDGSGGYAEYARVKENRITLKPASMSHAEAASVPSVAAVAYAALTDSGRFQVGQRVLIYGASGGVGTAAVQIAKALGAAHVSAVCGTRNRDLMQSLGADSVIDYTQDDYSRGAARYDLVFDAVGKSTFATAARVLAPGGTYVTVDFMSPRYFLLQALWTAVRGRKRAKTVFPDFGTPMLDQLRGLIDAGKLRPVIDRRYPLEQVADAHRYYEQGHVSGKIVIIVRD